MKKKVYLFSFILVMLIGFVTFTIYNKINTQSQHNEETKRQNQALDKESIEQFKKKISAKNTESFSIDLKNADAETIYNTFNGPNADSIIDLLEMDRDDSDRILVLPDGTILSGQVIIDENGTEVDSNTDKNSITVKELKDLILLNKQKIDELAAQNSPIE
ncbi:hypothetical protein A5821_001316 [Enterococcus sp. 7F3_DIV0205]|uniref:Uncharacterized protein n=1 Tax=Candidatus Enterococcus palustris TaxID=1834189 RepID=A0AAQ3Y5J5_9ENTE|nr:hypothetical protein [Enterococcus sp. 7F3_DIV0205]OTN85714.1 hypothetical protein A5821_001660 [Enterococcus sp. 7F3_DIV0205]